MILLHGLGRSAVSMKPLEKALNRAGYQVWNESYPSLRQDIPSLAEQSIEKGLAGCREQGAMRIHLVSHSLGGILIRQYLQTKAIDELGRIVMFSPPNQGSEVIEVLGDAAPLLGPAGLALGTGENSLPRRLLPISGDIGVITGNRSSDPWFSPSLPGPDDGKVSVESAKLQEMADFIVLPHGHTFILSSEQGISQALHFLQHARFDHPLLE